MATENAGSPAVDELSWPGLTRAAARLGIALTWPPTWLDLARSISTGAPLPALPSVYQPDVLRSLHTADSALARAVLRCAGPWSAAPHDDDDFNAIVAAWDRLDVDEAGGGSELDDATSGLCSGNEHFVAVTLADHGSPTEWAEVALCKDCGLPVTRRCTAEEASTSCSCCRRPDPAAMTPWVRLWPHISPSAPAPHEENESDPKA